MAKKFLFDNFFEDFGASTAADGPKVEDLVEEEMESTPEPQKPPAPSFTEEELEAVRNEAYREGRRAGLQQAAEEDERAFLLNLETLSHSIQELLAEEKSKRGEVLAEGLRFAGKLMGKVLPRYCERNGLTEIEKVVSDCMAHLREEPRLVIRVDDANLDRLRETIDEIARKSAFEGRIVMVAGENFGPSDVLVEWADGGAARSFERQWREIDALLSRILPSPSTYDEPGEAAGRPSEEITPGVASDTALKAAGNA